MLAYIEFETVTVEKMKVFQFNVFRHINVWTIRGMQSL